MSSGLVPPALPVRRKRNWLKHAAFTMLVVLGLVFWIPPLLRATVGETTDAPAPPDDTSREALASDGEFSNATPLETSLAHPSAANSLSRASDAIVLTTTILGQTHRAAILNGRLHREGDRIVVASVSFRLACVAEDRIELKSEHGDFSSERPLIIRRKPQHGGTK